MYHDPDWIFGQPQPKQYPNITGLMGVMPVMGDDKPKRKQRKVESLADIFATPDTNSRLFGGRFYEQNGAKMFTPTPNAIHDIGGADRYKQWFERKYPEVLLTFPLPQTPPREEQKVFEVQ